MLCPFATAIWRYYVNEAECMCPGDFSIPPAIPLHYEMTAKIGLADNRKIIFWWAWRCPKIKWGNSIRQKKEKNLASYSHRTATTARPCYIPVLGDSAGAGRIRLARGANVSVFFGNRSFFWNQGFVIGNLDGVWEWRFADSELLFDNLIIYNWVKKRVKYRLLTDFLILISMYFCCIKKQPPMI